MGGRENQAILGNDDATADTSEVANGLAGILHHAHHLFLALFNCLHGRISVKRRAQPEKPEKGQDACEFKNGFHSWGRRNHGFRVR